MKQRVNINIKGVYRTEGEESVAELFTDGTMFCRNGHTLLMYQETETTGYDGCVTTLDIEEGGRVTMVRRGAASSHLVLQRGVRHVGSYSVYGGAMEIGVFTDDLESRFDESGGNLHLTYTLDMNTTLMSENELFIDVTLPRDTTVAGESLGKDCEQ